jgi:hypothetical protein
MKQGIASIYVQELAIHELRRPDEAMAEGYFCFLEKELLHLPSSQNGSYPLLCRIFHESENPASLSRVL